MGPFGPFRARPYDARRFQVGFSGAADTGRVLVARYGGEGFCVVAPGTAAADAAIVAERLRAALEAATVVGYEDRRLQSRA